MKNKKFFGLYCGYSQEDIKEMIKNIEMNETSLMDNYILREIEGEYIMEDKWEAEPPRILQGSEEKIVLDAVALECLGKESRFQSLQELTEYMVREEEADMEAYLRNEEEWEY